MRAVAQSGPPYGARAAPSTTAAGTRVRKVLSREFSDSEVHQRVRRKPCTTLAPYRPQWQDGMELPRSLISCLSMLDLVSQQDDSGSSPPTPRDRDGSWCSLAGSSPIILTQQPRKHHSFRRVMSAGLLETHTRAVQEPRCPSTDAQRARDASTAGQLSPLPSDDSSEHGSSSTPASGRRNGLDETGVSGCEPVSVPCTSELPPRPPSPPKPSPARFESLVPTCFQWFGACHMVYLAGSFNEWKERIPLQRCPRGRDWAVVLNLPPGEYTYKYVVQAGPEEGLSWHHAPDQPAGRDQLGNINNYTVVLDQSAFEAAEAVDTGYSQHVPDEHFFLAPEPPSLPPHLQLLLGGVAGPSSSLDDEPAAPMFVDAGAADEPPPEPPHSILQHLSVAMHEPAAAEPPSPSLLGGWGQGFWGQPAPKPRSSLPPVRARPSALPPAPPLLLRLPQMLLPPRLTPTPPLTRAAGHALGQATLPGEILRDAAHQTVAPLRSGGVQLSPPRGPPNGSVVTLTAASTAQATALLDN